jgi:hypothetical protein
MKRRTGPGIVLALIGPILVGTPAPAGEPPAIVYHTDTGEQVITLGGQEQASFAPFQFVSLDGNVLAGSRHLPGDGLGELIRAADATTGQRLFTIKNAFAPIVLADGRKVGFMPDRFGHRDPFFSSVWLRNAAGRERRVVQFTGPKSTVGPTGFHGEGIPLDQAWDADGTRLAVTFGNDVDLFIFDVWVVEVATREATRMTSGKVSRFPSLSPSGDRLAVFREVDTCGGPGPEFRAGDIRIMLSTGEDRATLLTGDCDVFYTDPRWISEDELVAARLMRTAPAEYLVDLVRVDAQTAAVTELVTDGDVISFNVSASLQQMVYERRGVSPGFFVYDLATDQVTPFADGFLPQLAGVHRLV